MKKLLESLDTINKPVLTEGKTEKTEKGVKHTGDYGNSYDGDKDDSDEKSGKKGRPSKDSKEKHFDTDALSDVMGGKKKDEKKSLKDWIEMVDKTMLEGKTEKTEKGVKHTGDYGNSYDGDEEEVTSDKKGRGRPSKSDSAKHFDTDALSSVMGGKKVSEGKKVDKFVKNVEKSEEKAGKSKKDSENIAWATANKKGMLDNKNKKKTVKESEEEGFFVVVSSEDTGAFVGMVNKDGGKWRESAVAGDEPSNWGGTFMSYLTPQDIMQHMRNDFRGAQVKMFTDEEAAMSYAHSRGLESEYDDEELDEDNEQVSIAPAQQSTQIIKQGNKTLGTVNNPQLANTIKSAIGQGQMSLAGNEMKESKKAKPDFLDVDGDGDKDESFKKAEADKKAGPKKGVNPFAKKEVKEMKKIKESVETDTLGHIAQHYGHEVKNFMNGGKMDPDLHHALVDFYRDQKEIPRAILNGRDGNLNQWVDNRFKTDGIRFHQPEMVDEEEIFNPEVTRQTPAFQRKAQGKNFPMTMKQATDTNHISDGEKLRAMAPSHKPVTPQFESWDRQLKQLLSEGMNVSSSSGQEGQPDSVSITATDADAQELLAIVRQAGLGVFGGGEEEPESSQGGFSLPQELDGEIGAGEESPVGIEVVDDADDMLDIIRKLSGQTSTSPDIEEVPSDEDVVVGDETYDVDGDADGEPDTATADEAPFDDEESAEEPTDADDSEEKEELVDEENCESCGQKTCECDEQVEESTEDLANSAHDTSTQDIDFMTKFISGGLNKQKADQTTGNIQKVKQMNESISDMRKLAGLK